jgi:ribosomal protein S18 acetylase RimI-like enzyme
MNIINLCEQDLQGMYELFNEFVHEQYFLKELSFEQYKDKLLSNPDFDFNSVFGIKENNELIAYCIGYIRKMYIHNENVPGYVNMIIVKKEYRKQGIGSSLLTHLEKYFKENNRKYIQASYYLPSCYSWYIPNTDKHDHPCAPGIRINSAEYFFLLHNGYHMQGQIDAFHLDLAKFEMPANVLAKMKENEEKGLTIEVFDPNKHYGVDEFCEAIQNPGFARSIKYNLNREVPRPFLIVSDNNRMAGWTGPMYTESTGRGHLDGICVDPDTRGGGLGKALFCNLCDYLKRIGSSYMTFFTGLDNPARRIYLFAGFKIAQSFADMKKDLK